MNGTPSRAEGMPAARHQFWTIAQVKTNRESFAARQIRRQQCACYYPRHRPDPRRARTRPLFPGYVFARVTADRWSALNRLSGVCAVLSSQGKPARVGHGVIVGLRRCEQAELGAPLAPRFAVGDSVRIKFGPLAGLVGRLSRFLRDDQIEVLLGFMGQQSKMRVRADCLSSL